MLVQRFYLFFFIFSLIFFPVNAQTDSTSLKVWVFFRDKPDNSETFHKAARYINDKAMQRRARVQADIDWFDLDVNEAYLERLSPFMVRIGHVSRWLNAVSMVTRTADLDKIRALPFVRDIRPVARRAKRLPQEDVPSSEQPPAFYKTHALDYGLSYNQLQMLNVPQLHDSGYSGKGVVIAMLDDGFSHYKKHVAFTDLKVLDTWDFVNNNRDVDDPDARENHGYHGSKTLSAVGGYAPGELIGPAYGASFLLAKTEIDSIEVPQEEDNWVAGLEWAEANGADVVSSSLGYIDWYTWENMDGKTAVTTLATNVAEQKGVVVVNAAGNERDNADHNTLIAPADGVFVITAGGVTSDGNYWSGASVGPTVDGRIKPDLAAQAANTRVISTSITDGYVGNNGTSFATPLIAGVVALLLEAHPQSTPEQIREALYQTASRASVPVRFVGYGGPDAVEAARYLETHRQNHIDRFRLNANYPNPFMDYTTVIAEMPELSRISAAVYNSRGQEVFKLPLKEAEGKVSYLILGQQLPSAGIYFFRLRATGISSGKTYNSTVKIIHLH